VKTQKGDISLVQALNFGRSSGHLVLTGAARAKLRKEQLMRSIKKVKASLAMSDEREVFYFGLFLLIINWDVLLEISV